MKRNKKERALKIRWKKWLNYKSVVRQTPFFLFLAGLAVVYIYNGHLADKTAREYTKTTTELNDLKAEYKFVKGDALRTSTQSEIRDAVVPLGLKELTVSPVVLKDSTTEKE